MAKKQLACPNDHTPRHSEASAMHHTKNKAKQANKVRRVDRRTNALPTNRPTDQRTQPVIEVLCRRYNFLQIFNGLISFRVPGVNRTQRCELDPCHLHPHYWRSSNYGHQNVVYEEGASPIFERLIWKAPDIAQTNDIGHNRNNCLYVAFKCFPLVLDQRHRR